MYQIVSSATPDYYPGIIALWNSIKINSSKCSLAVYCYDNTEEYKKLEELGISVILNAPMPGPIIGKGKIRTGTGAPVNEDMYARLLAPLNFSGKVFYVDADCLILQPIYELWDTLDLNSYPTACVWREDIGWKGGNIEDEMASGTFLADTDKWREMGLMEKCFDTMKKVLDKTLNKTFAVNVESVLSYVHNRKYLRLDRVYQNLTYYGKLSKEDKVAHFAAVKPWIGKCNYRQLWKAYLNNDVEKAKQIESQLPDKKWGKIHPRNRTQLRASQNKWS